MPLLTEKVEICKAFSVLQVDVMTRNGDGFESTRQSINKLFIPFLILFPFFFRLFFSLSPLQAFPVRIYIIVVSIVLFSGYAFLIPDFCHLTLGIEISKFLFYAILLAFLPELFVSSPFSDSRKSLIFSTFNEKTTAFVANVCFAQ